MKTAIRLLLIITPLLFHCCESRADDGSLWLARSCVGEAGWDSWGTGECLMMLHLYRKRAAAFGGTTVSVAKRYSAAIKRYKGRPRRWLLDLDRTGPGKSWPRRYDWSRFAYHWAQTRFLVALFEQGRTVDPCPECWHYGGSMDTPSPRMGKRLDMPYRNRVYGRK